MPRYCPATPPAAQEVPGAAEPRLRATSSLSAGARAGFPAAAGRQRLQRDLPEGHDPLGGGETQHRPGLLLQDRGGGCNAARLGKEGASQGEGQLGATPPCRQPPPRDVSFPAQVVSDTRRLSDVEWFQDVYGAAVQLVRVVATEETRKRRNWVFIVGEWHRFGVTTMAENCQVLLCVQPS